MREFKKVEAIQYFQYDHSIFKNYNFNTSLGGCTSFLRELILTKIIAFLRHKVKMMLDKNKNISFKKEAIYKIVVHGELSDSSSKKFPELQIKVSREKRNKPFTSLIGEIKDQAALTGILNSLYDMQYTVISVNMLSDIDFE